MNDVQIFSNPEFGEIRTAMVNEEPLFLVNDVCAALGHSNPRKAVTDHCSTKDVTKRDTLTRGGTQSMTYVNESGLYSLIMGSKLSQAQQFKHWVTSEVLPAIRKHGAYMTPEKIEEVLLNPDTIIQLATSLKEERTERLRLEAINREQAPKVLFASAVETSHNSCLVGELAKILCQNGVEIGQNRLFEWLRENNYLCTKGESHNIPTPKAMEQGLFEIKKRTINNPDGSSLVTTTTKVTGKGQIYFTSKFLSKE